MLQETDQHLDILYLNRFLDLVSQALIDGYGEVNFRVTVQKGKITQIKLNREESYLIDSPVKKE